MGGIVKTARHRKKLCRSEADFSQPVASGQVTAATTESLCGLRGKNQMRRAAHCAIACHYRSRPSIRTPDAGSTNSRISHPSYHFPRIDCVDDDPGLICAGLTATALRCVVFLEVYQIDYRPVRPGAIETLLSSPW